MPLIAAARLGEGLVAEHSDQTGGKRGLVRPALKEPVRVALLHRSIEGFADGVVLIAAVHRLVESAEAHHGVRRVPCAGNGLRAVYLRHQRVKERRLIIELIAVDGLQLRLDERCAVGLRQRLAGKALKILRQIAEVGAQAHAHAVLAQQHGRLAGIRIAAVALDGVDDLDRAGEGHILPIILGGVKALRISGQIAVENGETAVHLLREGPLVEQERHAVAVVPEHVVAEHLREEAYRHHRAVGGRHIGADVHLHRRAVGARDDVAADNMGKARLFARYDGGLGGLVKFDPCAHRLQRGAQRHHRAPVLHLGHRVGESNASVAQQHIDLPDHTAERLDVLLALFL